MAKQPRVWDGSQWQELAVQVPNMSNYAYLPTTPVSGFRNAIINGGFDVWQRGTSSLSIGNTGVSASTTADRWASYRPANPTAITVSRISGSGVINAPYAARIQRTSGNTTTEKVTFGQTIEIANASKLSGQAITFSFYARSGSNFSASGSTVTTIIKTGTGTTDLNGIYNGYTGETTDTINNTLTTSFQRFTRTISLNSNVTQIAISFEFTPTGTAGANDYIDITGVQLEAGSVATPFEQRPIGTELALCQRYYYRLAQNTGRYGAGYAKTTTTADVIIDFPVTMRTNPSALEQSGTAGDYLIAYQNSAVAGSSVPTFTNATVKSGTVNFTVGAVLTAGNGVIAGPNGANSYLGWSAEL